MVYAHEKPKGNDGPVRIGATGKVSDLMTQELDSHKSTTKTSATSKRTQTSPVSTSCGASRKAPTTCQRKTQSSPVSISCGVSTRRLQRRLSSSNMLDTSRSLTNRGNHRRPVSTDRKKQTARQTSQVPMLDVEDLYIDKTPIRVKPESKVSQLVEMVDLKCGDPDGAWSGPISNQLRRLSFSKLSD